MPSDGIAKGVRVAAALGEKAKANGVAFEGGVGVTGFEAFREADSRLSESVVRIEFARQVADEVLADHQGTEVDYAVNLWWKRF